MSRNWKWACIALAALLAAGILSGGLAWAKKPPKDPPPEPDPPAGTIYFQYGNEVWGMKGDGSGKLQALPADVTGIPSHLLYGAGYRWWLTSKEDGRTYDRVLAADGTVLAENWPHRELYAFRKLADGSLETVELTDTFGSIGYLSGQVYWSNDGADSFVSFVGHDISNGFSTEEDGTTTVDWSLVERDLTFQADVSGTEIDLGVAAGIWAPLTPEDIDVVGSFQRVANAFDGYHWGPAGDVVVHVVEDSPGDDLWITNLLTNESSPLLVSENSVHAPRWSPILADGTTQIAFEYQRNIWTIDPVTRQSAPLHVSPPSGAFLMEPKWSPDGAYVVFKEQNLRRADNISFYIRLLPAEGSRKHVDLSEGLDKSRNQKPIAWVSDDSAP